MRVFLSDDEPLAREGMRLRLADVAGIEIVGEAATGRETIERVPATRPDLLFLDIEMPERDGFEVLEAIGPLHLPLVVFVTAFDHYAVRAFEAHALDYLLKPVSAGRLEETLERARRMLELGNARDDAEKVAAFLQAHRATHEPIERFVVAESGRLLFVKAEDVEWIGAAGNYVELHVGARALLLRETLSAIAERLDPRRFARIHRSTIVNLDRIREVERDWHGDGMVILHSGRALRMSRSYRSGLIAAPRSR